MGTTTGPFAPGTVDWTRVGHATFEVRQGYCYTYSRPIKDLHQRLVVVPPDRHGDQVLLWHTLDVRGATPPGYQVSWERDAFGNHVCYVDAPYIAHTV